MAGCLVLLMLAGAAVPAIAQQGSGSEPAARERAEAERELAEAQRRLEEAAREVAELSMQISGPVVEEIRRIHVAGPGRAMLGVNVGNAEPGVNGAKVISVSPGGPAAEAGVKAGDLIVAINGKQLGSSRDLITEMRRVEPGDTVDLDLRRGGSTELKVGVETKPSEEMVFFGGGPGGPGGLEWQEEGMPPLPHFLSGPFGDAELVPMSPGLGRYFGTDKGLLVVHAPKATGTDLEDGDVILAIGGREPQNPGHALRILGSYQPGETVELKVLRQKKERTVKLTVPEGPRIERHIRMVAPPAPPAPPPRAAGGQAAVIMCAAHAPRRFLL
jgi:predicted metalloprotease with PDZ domain